MKQITDTVLMVRPYHFAMNEETAVNNFFQQELVGISRIEILENAQKEFDGFVEKLREKGIHVIVATDDHEIITPDSIFPNNWVTFHENGDVCLFPMYAPSRRLERRDDVLYMAENAGFNIERVIDLSGFEKNEKYLEGTGSMILDRENAIAYCALSARSNREVLEEFCELFGYRPIIFTANQNLQSKRVPIYHTNVVMTLGESFAVICLDSIDNESEKEVVIRSLKRTEKEIISISEAQLENFAGNMLQLMNENGERFLVMSQTAFDSLDKDQLQGLKKHTEILAVEIPTIEKIGGGSARCMLAEVFVADE